MTRRIVIGVLANFFVLILLARGDRAAGAGAGVIEVTVLNGSAHDAPVVAQPVTLHERSGQVTLPTRELNTDQAGSVQFVDLDTSSSAAFEVTTDFGDVTYGTESLSFAGSATHMRSTLNVWETTNVDPGLKVDVGLLVLTKPDYASQSIGVLELLTIVNPSERTYVPSTSGPNGAMGLLRFGLPPESSTVQTEAGLDPTRIVQISAGFASSSPISPGKHQIGYAYRFPYQGPTYAFTKSITLPTDDFRVLAPPGAFNVASGQLASAGIAEVGQQTYAVWKASSLPPGTKVSFQLGEMPERSLMDRVVPAVPRDGVPPIAIVPVAALAATIPIIYGSRLKAKQGMPKSGLLGADNSIQQIVELDEQHDAGLLSDGDHATRRAALVAQAVRLHRSIGKRA